MVQYLFGDRFSLEPTTTNKKNPKKRWQVKVPMPVAWLGISDLNSEGVYEPFPRKAKTLKYWHDWVYCQGNLILFGPPIKDRQYIVTYKQA